MSQSLKAIHFRTVDNQNRYLPFQMIIDLNREKIVKHLRQRIALRFYRDPQYIHLLYNNKQLNNHQQLKDLDLNNSQQQIVTIISQPPKRKANPNYQPLIIGGLTLNDIKELEFMMKSKKYSFLTNNVQVNEVVGGQVKVIKEEQDLNVKYKNQLLELKSIFSSQFADDILLFYLQQAGGDANKAALALSNINENNN